MIENKLYNCCLEVSHIKDVKMRAEALLEILKSHRIIHQQALQEQEVIIENMTAELNRYFEEKEYCYVIGHLQTFIKTGYFKSTECKSTEDRFIHLKRLFAPYFPESNIEKGFIKIKNVCQEW